MGGAAALDPSCRDCEALVSPAAAPAHACNHTNAATGMEPKPEEGVPPEEHVEPKSEAEPEAEPEPELELDAALPVQLTRPRAQSRGGERLASDLEAMTRAVMNPASPFHAALAESWVWEAEPGGASAELRFVGADAVAYVLAFDGHEYPGGEFSEPFVALESYASRDAAEQTRVEQLVCQLMGGAAAADDEPHLIDADDPLLQPTDSHQSEGGADISYDDWARASSNSARLERVGSGTSTEVSDQDGGPIHPMLLRDIKLCRQVFGAQSVRTERATDESKIRVVLELAISDVLSDDTMCAWRLSHPPREGMPSWHSAWRLSHPPTLSVAIDVERHLYIDTASVPAQETFKVTCGGACPPVCVQLQHSVLGPQTGFIKRWWEEKQGSSSVDRVSGWRPSSTAANFLAGRAGGAGARPEGAAGDPTPPQSDDDADTVADQVLEVTGFPDTSISLPRAEEAVSLGSFNGVWRHLRGDKLGGWPLYRIDGPEERFSYYSAERSAWVFSAALSAQSEGRPDQVAAIMRCPPEGQASLLAPAWTNPRTAKSFDPQTGDCSLAVSLNIEALSGADLDEATIAAVQQERKLPLLSLPSGLHSSQDASDIVADRVHVALGGRRPQMLRRDRPQGPAVRVLQHTDVQAPGASIPRSEADILLRQLAQPWRELLDRGFAGRRRRRAGVADQAIDEVPARCATAPCSAAVVDGDTASGCGWLWHDRRVGLRGARAPTGSGRREVPGRGCRRG